MTKAFFKSLLLLTTWLAISKSNAQGPGLTVASYNLRYDSPGDSGNLWKNRRSAVIKLIRYHDFDIFGTQEGLKNQLDDILDSLPYYATYGKGRDDGENKGEHSNIFFKEDKFKLLKSGDFWLSQTPEQPSLGWDATCCNRICSWIYLKDKTSNKSFYFFNAHFDHQGVVARKESSKLILRMIDSIAGDKPVIFSGDLNGSHESDWYLTLKNSGKLEDTYNGVDYPYVQNASFNAFGQSLEGDAIIDHIFTSKHFKIKSWAILTDTYHGKFPSDHFPVVAKVSLQ